MTFASGPVRVKICCISSLDEARLAISHGANALGLVSAMPSGPGVIDEALIEAIAARTPPGVSSFLLTSKQEAEALIAQQRRLRATTLQLVDTIEPAVYRALRAALPGVQLVQVVHVTGPESLDEAREVAPLVDAVLLDSGNPNLAVKELGGTGRVHNWDTSAAIVAALDRPVFLAGGLNPENAREAIARVKPFGLDICSGVRSHNALDPEKLARFMVAVRNIS